MLRHAEVEFLIHGVAIEDPGGSIILADTKKYSCT